MAAEAGQVEIPILPDLSSFGTLLAVGLRGSMGSVQGIFSAISKNWGVALAAGIAAGVGASIKSAVAYEQSFRRVAAITDASTADLGRWRDELLDVSSLTAQAPQELADALYFLASAGLKMSDVMGVLKVAAQGSAVGLGDVHTLSLVTAQALNAFSDQGLTATEAMDALTAAVRVGAVEPDQLAASLGRVMPIADAVGLSFQEVVGSISAMTNAGLDAYESTTALRQLLANIAAPSVEAAGAMSQMGISTQVLRDTLSKGGLLAALDLLGKKSKMNFDVMRRIIPNIRALAGFYNLTRDEMQQAAETMDAVINSQGDLAVAFGKTQSNVSFQLARLGNNFEVLKVRAGEAFLPLVNTITQALNGLMPILGELANHANLVLAAFILWRGLPLIITGVSRALALLGAQVASEQLAGAGLRQLYYIIAGLVGQIPGIGRLVAAFGGLGSTLASIAVIVGGGIGIEKTISGYREAEAAGNAFEILGQKIRIPQVALDDLRESSTGFIGNLTRLGHTITGTGGLWDEYNDKVNSVKAAMLEAARSGVPLNEIQKNLATNAAQITDIFDEFPAGSSEAQQAIAQIIEGQYAWTDATRQTGQVLEAAINQGYRVSDLVPKFRDAAGVIGLAGMSVQEFGQAAVTAFNKGQPAFNKFVSDMSTKLTDAMGQATSDIANGINFANDALSSFVEHSHQGLGTFIANLGKAGDKTTQYGKDLLEISRNGGEALAQSLIAAGTAGASAARRIASGTDKARDHAIAMFNKVSGGANTLATKLSQQIYGTLEDILGVLEEIAAHGFTATVTANVAAAEAAMSHFVQEWNGRTINVNLGVTTPSEIGNIFGKAKGGPVVGGVPILVGEKGPEVFVPKTAGKIIPNNALKPRNHEQASGGMHGGVLNVTLARRNVMHELDRQVRYGGR